MRKRLIDDAIVLTVVTLAAGCGGKEPVSPPPPPPPPPTPTQLAFTVQPGQAMRDSLMVPAVTVEVRGASGSRITGATNTVTLALGVNPAGAVLTGTTSVSAVAGVATFTNLHVNQQARGYTIVAASGSLTPDTSAAFDIVIPLHPNFVVPGTEHSCAQVAYSIYCWGRNTTGELGDSTLTSHSLPVLVASSWPGGAAVSHVALGEHHTCVTTSVAEAYCWGSDSSGQLGVGSQNDQRLFPALVSGGLSFANVTAGSAHTCAVAVPSPDSTYVYCWGANDHGQLGDSTNTQRNAPVPLAPHIAFSAVTAGKNHTCAIATATGLAYCWGDNTLGQLGDSSTTARNSPVRVAGGHTFVEVSAGGNHTCGVTPALEAYCWGENGDGQLGDSTTTQRTYPVLVAGGIGFSRIAVGGQFSCARGSDQKPYCWGRNQEGELGIGTLVSHPTPQLVSGNLNLTGIEAGDRHACAATSDGVAYCWGANTNSKLGDGTTTTRSSPVLVVF